MSPAVALSEEQPNHLCEKADCRGIQSEQLAIAAVADLIAAKGPDLDSAASRVLEKNQECYRRLA